MDDPHDDTDVPSGTTDGAQMESTSPPVHRLEAHQRPADGLQLICLIFSEVFWLSKCAELASLIKK